MNRLMHDVELHARLNFGAHEDGIHLYWAAMALFRSNEMHGLDMLQAVLELCKIESSPSYEELSIQKSSIDELNRLLIAGGSKWHVVVTGKSARVEARVNETSDAAYQHLVQSGEAYAPLLKKSWEHCYGRKPNPSEAYTFAIKAVEAAAWKIITPKNDKSTLGTMIKDLPAQASAGKIENGFKDKRENDSVEVIVGLMRRLWEGQTDRHATGNYIEPNQAEAEAAVHISLTLCHLFSKGVFIRK